MTDDEADVLDEQRPCKHCGLPLEEHDDPDFCPPGTEEFGGRR